MVTQGHFLDILITSLQHFYKKRMETRRICSLMLGIKGFLKIKDKGYTQIKEDHNGFNSDLGVDCFKLKFCIKGMLCFSHNYILNHLFKP